MEKIRVFVIDPAWRQRKGGLRKSRGNQGRELDYVTMEVPEIFGLLDREIFPLAEDDHCVFMWTIDRFLLECENEMEKRGYKRHCRMIWNKLNGVAPAFTVRYSHEYLIWFYRKRLPPIAGEQRGKFMTVFAERSRQRHIAVNILVLILTLDLVVKSIEIIRLVSELPPAVPAFP